MRVLCAAHLVAHEIRQPHQVLDVMAARAAAFGDLPGDAWRIAVAQPLAIRLGGYVQQCREGGTAIVCVRVHKVAAVVVGVTRIEFRVGGNITAECALSLAQVVQCGWAAQFVGAAPRDALRFFDERSNAARLEKHRQTTIIC